MPKKPSNYEIAQKILDNAAKQAILKRAQAPLKNKLEHQMELDRRPWWVKEQDAEGWV